MNEKVELHGTSGDLAVHRRWFPCAFGASGWLILGAWAYFIAVLIAVNYGKQVPRVLSVLFYWSSIITLWGGPLWLFFGSAFALSAGLKAGGKEERIQLVALLIITLAYFTTASVLD